MARHSRRVLPTLVIVAGAFMTAEMRGSQVPPVQPPPQQQPQQQQKTEGHDRRGWWHDKRVVDQLVLTNEQVEKLDRIFVKHTEKAVPLRKEVQDLEKALDEAVRTQKLDVKAFAQQVDRIENKRAELNKMRAVMLYRLRLVLNAEQNKKFQAMLDRREAERRKQDDRRH
jgi:Spy/CpxP family protein refolding chaperone